MKLLFIVLAGSISSVESEFLAKQCMKPASSYSIVDLYAMAAADHLKLERFNPKSRPV